MPKGYVWSGKENFIQPVRKAFFQCCQLLANFFGQINQKFRPLAKNAKSSEKLIISMGSNMTVLMQNQTTKKVWPLFGPFLKNLPKVRPQILPGQHNLFPPLLCFAAEISAPWQH
jgi:hypothetical protein